MPNSHNPLGGVPRRKQLDRLSLVQDLLIQVRSAVREGRTAIRQTRVALLLPCVRRGLFISMDCTCQYKEAKKVLSHVEHAVSCDLRRALEITIPALPPALNSLYAGQHWSKRYKMAQEWHNTFLWAFRAARWPSKLRTPIRIEAIGYGKRPRDADGQIVSVKLALDALVKGGYLPDDSPEFVKEIRLRSEKAKENKVEIDVIEAV